jgi:hypothetical protein
MQVKGYTLVKEFFVDSSGLGTEDEPALTRVQFEIELIKLLNEYGALDATITRAGQFQVYVGLFKKKGKPTGKKVARNTYALQEDGIVYAIRFHDTNILTYEADRVTLDNGGYQTATTKERFNRFLPKGVSIYQKNFTWYVKDTRDGTTKEFTNGMIIAS